MDLLQNNKAAHSPVAQKITDSPTIEISDGQLDQLLLEQQLHIKTNHSSFPSMQEFRQKLPIWSRKDKILETIHNHQVIVLCGETGSGVVTQVGQFVLDQAIESGRGSSIRAICTQPRGRAAALVAQRVAQERCEPCGGNTSSVGYWIGQELSRPPREKGSIIFCTTDMLFHHLQCDTNLDNFSHIFLDQVHERDVQMDLLLIALRDVLPKRPLLKLILISSTTYTNIFPQYLPSCPVLVIHGMIHPVETIHLEEILSQLDYKFEPSKSRRGRFGPLTSEDILDNEYKLLVGPSLLRMEAEENYPEHVLMSLCVRESEDSPVDLILALLKRICSGEHTGSILIFFPGVAEINTTRETLLADPLFSRQEFLILQFYSTHEAFYHYQIFNKAAQGVRKIVLSTDIGETAIIDDVAFVIDCGKIKYTDNDSTENANSVKSQWVNQEIAKQRQNHAGRTQPGICYRLYSSMRQSSFLPDTASLEKMNVEELILRIKLLNQA